LLYFAKIIKIQTKDSKQLNVENILFQTKDSKYGFVENV